MLFFRHQHETGALADHIDQQDVSFVYTKPPIHGWILAHLLELLGPIDADRRSTLYESLKEWTRWWLRYRDDDGDGICQYNHGNDSGWDNATVFDVGQPVESPDLSAYLIVQMDVLSRLARDMGKSDEASRWAGEADRTLMRLLKHSWRGDRFVAPRSGDHAIASDADSLILLLPIVLGKRLPRAIRKAIVARLRDGAGFLTPHGLATENVGSPNYLPFGYWRGPIWAPSTLIVVDGLTQIAEHGLAREVADRFCEMCRANGFAENFDALTGAARCDPAYTWTPSVFTILAQEYLA
jgi:glycogen debranching enzyme